MTESSEDRLVAALQQLPEKPSDEARQTEKKRYSERLSAMLALFFAEELRRRGMTEARPGGPGDFGGSGAERRMAGGIGAKKVDVTWATETAGLLVGISIKSINFRDKRSGNFQKNFTNRRGDLLFEAVTLHRRFPYAVLAAFFIFDQAAAGDATKTRRSTFENVCRGCRLFNGRSDPAGRDEQFERFFVVLHDSNKFAPGMRFFVASQPEEPMTLAQALDDLVSIAAERNSDFYELAEHVVLRKVVSRTRGQAPDDE